MKERNRIVFHRGYNIFASKYGTFTLLPKNVQTVHGLKECEEQYGYTYMLRTHPEFNSLEECKTYIDTNYPET